MDVAVSPHEYGIPAMATARTKYVSANVARSASEIPNPAGRQDSKRDCVVAGFFSAPSSSLCCLQASTCCLLFACRLTALTPWWEQWMTLLQKMHVASSSFGPGLHHTEIKSPLASVSFSTSVLNLLFRPEKECAAHQYTQKLTALYIWLNSDYLCEFANRSAIISVQKSCQNS